MANKARRKKAEKMGRRAEWKAAAFLTLKGYRVQERRFKTLMGEIDLVCSKADTLIFVEVKARQSVEQAVEAVTWHAQKRIERASEIYVSKQPDAAQSLGRRFDVIAVMPNFTIHHIIDAWRPDSAVSLG